MTDHNPETCPCPCHAARYKFNRTERRKAYQRDRIRGARHRASGKPMESNPSRAYRVGYEAVDR